MGAEQSVMQYDTLFYDHPNESEVWTAESLLSSLGSCIPVNPKKTKANKPKEEDKAEARPWRLKLPINGQIALRRCLRRGSDPFEEERKQRSRLEHDYLEKFGPLRNIDVVFKEVLWSAEDQSWSRMAKKFDGVDLSPGSVPRVEQMSFREYVEMVGAEAMGLAYVEDEEYEQEALADDLFGDLLECNYYARRRSDIFAEDWFNDFNPYEGHPKSA